MGTMMTTKEAFVSSIPQISANPSGLNLFIVEIRG